MHDTGMGGRKPDYAMKSPRGRPHDVVAQIFDFIEDAIHVVVAALLVVAGAFVLWSAATELTTQLQSGTQPLKIVSVILDKGLYLFIIAELLHTVRVTIQERTLVVEPFLIVGLIAGVRRLLLVTAQIAETTTNGGTRFQWNPQGIEIVVLLALVLGMTLALILWRRFYGRTGMPEA
jgi:uncharacterized membrane protein (DUF373 family)